MTLSIAVSCWLWCAVAPAAARQDPASRPTGFGGDAIAGTVLEVAGKPVAGAAVFVEPGGARDRAAHGTFEEAALHQLRWTPLPAGVTDANGRFSLQLTRDQARLGVLGGVQLVLAVEKDGLRPCRRQVGACLGRVGEISVRLERSTDLVEGRIVVPGGASAPKGRIDVVYDMRNWRLDAGSMYALPMDGGRVFAVPRLGPVIEAGPPRSGADQIRSIGFHLVPSFEGFATEPRWFPPDAGRFELALVPAEVETAADVDLAEGAEPPAELTVLYQHMDLGSWVRNVPFGPVRRVGDWQARGVEAAGFAGSQVEYVQERGLFAARLVPLPRESVRLHVAEKGGGPVAGAEVEVLEMMSKETPGPAGGGRKARQVLRARTDRAGCVEIAPERFDRVSSVTVRANGYAHSSSSLAKCLSEPRIELRRIATGTLRLLVSQGKAPVGGATILLSDSAYFASSPPGPPPRTAEDGTLALELAAGTHTVVAWSEGCAFVPVEFELAAGARLDLEVKLESSRGDPIRLTDNKGRPLARTPVAWRFTVHDPRLHLSGFSYTDDDGRVRLDGMPPRDHVALVVPGFADRSAPDYVFLLDPTDPPRTVELDPVDPGEIVLLLPPGVAEGLFLRKEHRGGGSHSTIRLFGAEELRTTKEEDLQSITLESPVLPVLPATIEPGPDRVTVDSSMKGWPEIVIDADPQDAAAGPLRVAHVVGAVRAGRGMSGHGGFDLSRLWRRPEDPPSRHRFRVPPEDAFTVALEHPGFLVMRLEYRDGRGSAGTVRMVRGATLTLAVPLPAKDRGKGTHWTGALSASLVRAGDPGNRGANATDARSIPINVIETGEPRWLEIPWPTALAPGTYTFKPEKSDLFENMSEPRTFEVKGTEPVRLEFGKLREPAPARDR